MFFTGQLKSKMSLWWLASQMARKKPHFLLFTLWVIPASHIVPGWVCATKSRKDDQDWAVEDTAASFLVIPLPILSVPLISLWGKTVVLPLAGLWVTQVLRIWSLCPKAWEEPKDSCQQPCELESKPSNSVMPSGDYSRFNSLSATSWQSLSQNHPARSFPACSTKTVCDDKC